MKLLIGNKIFKKYPELKLGVLVVQGVNNVSDEKGSNEIAKMLDGVVADTEKKFIDKLPDDIEEVKAWRKVYSDFGTNPAKHRSSVESLLARIVAGDGLPEINKMVNLYNLISVKHVIPAGGEDLSKIDGDLYLRYSDGDETFQSLGSKDVGRVPEGEIVYADDVEVLVRRWNWRESEKTKISESTKKAVFVLEGLTKTHKEVKEAVVALGEMIKKYCGGRVTYFVLDRDTVGIDVGKLKTIIKSQEIVMKKKKVFKKDTVRKTYEPKNDIEKEIYNIVKKELPKQYHDNLVVEIPPNNIADFAVPCFAFGGNPKKASEKLSNAIKIPKKSIISDAKSMGPYLNFTIDAGVLSKLVIGDILQKKEKYGSGRKGRKVLLEHTSVNPSGPIHVGRLRNSLIGDSLKRILGFYGHDVDTHYYVNDLGKQMALIKWGVHNKIKPDATLLKEYEKYNTKKDFKTFFTYVAANADRTETKDEEVAKILQDAESGKGLKELQDISKSCLSGQKAILKELGIEFDVFDFESTYVENGGSANVMKKLDKYLIKKDGAIGLDLGKFGLGRRSGILVLKRSDGTFVYITRDIAYHLEKAKKSDWIINVLGEDHKVEFIELSKILKEYFKIKSKIEAVHFAFVNFKGVQLSTRKGQTAPLDALLDEGVKKAENEIEKRNGDKKLAKDIAVAAIRYHILKTALNKQITFIWKDALSFEGDTGPYLQYTHARAKAILRKAGSKGKVGELGDSEKPLVKYLDNFPNVIETASEELSPHGLANYLFELASLFNEYYHKTKVIGSKNEKERLALVNAVAQVLKNGLELLGIKALEKM